MSDMESTVVRYLATWNETDPVVGFDVVEFTPDGHIATVLGFLDKVPG